MPGHLITRECIFRLSSFFFFFFVLEKNETRGGGRRRLRPFSIIARDMRASKDHPTSIRPMWNREPGDKAGARIQYPAVESHGVGREREKEGDKEKIRRAPNIDGVRWRASTLNALSYVRALCERCLVVSPHRLRALKALSPLSPLPSM